MITEWRFSLWAAIIHFNESKVLFVRLAFTLFSNRLYVLSFKGVNQPNWLQWAPRHHNFLGGRSKKRRNYALVKASEQKGKNNQEKGLKKRNWESAWSSNRGVSLSESKSTWWSVYISDCWGKTGLLRKNRSKENMGTFVRPSLALSGVAVGDMYWKPMKVAVQCQSMSLRVIKLC